MDLLLLFISRVANPVIKGLVLLLCSNLTRPSRLSDPQTSFCTAFTTRNFQINHMRIKFSCEQYEFSSDQVCVSVKGRLRRALDFWREINAPQFILDVIEFVYKLPLLQIPTPFSARNNSSALEHSAFVEKPFPISLDKVVLLKFLRGLSSSILCPFLSRNLAKSVSF